jgi:hypothetical protein
LDPEKNKKIRKDKEKTIISLNNQLRQRTRRTEKDLEKVNSYEPNNHHDNEK